MEIPYGIQKEGGYSGQHLGYSEDSMGGNGYKGYGERGMSGYGTGRYDGYPVMSNQMR